MRDSVLSARGAGGGGINRSSGPRGSGRRVRALAGAGAVVLAVVLGACSSSSGSSAGSASASGSASGSGSASAGGSAAASGKVSGTVVVFAATSLTEAFNKIGAQFEADAGIVYVTDAKANEGKATGVTIPADQNDITAYPIAELKGAPNPAGAAAFISYVLGPDGQKVLAGLGFMPPG
jgi:ABC-type molybdate transport system substrate-binding protein